MVDGKGHKTPETVKMSFREFYFVFVCLSIIMLSLLDVADPIICRMIEWDVSLNGSVLSHPRPSAEPNAVCTIITERSHRFSNCKRVGGGNLVLQYVSRHIV